MLLQLLLTNTFLSTAVCGDSGGSVTKPYVFPIPFNLPNRNDRADQCWIRIEDVELIETVNIYCHLAHEFLRNFIPEYNSRKMTDDNVDVSLWNAEPKIQEERAVPKPSESNNGKVLLDWKVTTISDPTMHMRLYVSQRADCKLVMYSREGMSNYKVDCAKLLYFVNERASGSAIISPASMNFLTSVCISVILLNF